MSQQRGKAPEGVKDFDVRLRAQWQHYYRLGGKDPIAEEPREVVLEVVVNFWDYEKAKELQDRIFAMLNGE